MSIKSENEAQDAIIAVLKEEFKEFKICNSREHENIVDKMVDKHDLDIMRESTGRRMNDLVVDGKDLRNKVDNHCIRIRETEKSLAVLIEELKPTKNFVENLQSKILVGFFALLTLLGAIIYAAIRYVEKK